MRTVLLLFFVILMIVQTRVHNGHKGRHEYTKREIRISYEWVFNCAKISR